MGKIVACVLMVSASTDVHAQAWTQPAGAAYVRLAQGWASADERYDADGTVVPYDELTGGDVRDRSTYLYAEAGLTDRLTLIGLLPFKRIVVTDETVAEGFERRSQAWGTAQLGARFDIGPSLGLDPEGPTVLAANVRASLPLGYTRNYRPAVGAGQVDLEASLDIGRSLWPFPGYVQAGLGFRHRTGLFGLSSMTDCTRGEDQEGHACLDDAEVRREFGDEFLLTAEGGITLGPVLLQTLLDAAWSVRAPENQVAGTTIQPEAFALRRVVRVGLGAAVQGPAGIGIGVQAFTAAHAQNVLKATEVFVGIEKRF